VSVVHDQAICLRHREWSETSQTVILLTRAHGLINGLAKGSRRDRSPFSGGFEALQRGEVGFVQRADKDMLTVTEWDLGEAYGALRGRYGAAVACLFTGEVAAGLLPAGDPHPVIFDAFCGLLDACARERAEPGFFLRPIAACLGEVLRDTGHQPRLSEASAAGGAGRGPVLLFDPGQACLVPRTDAGMAVVDPFAPTASRTGCWAIRRETVGLLASLESPDLGRNRGEPRGWARACRFLGAWAVYRSGRRPASLDAFLRVTRF
jgi:DNA repair protein RecO (recombination protein O)